MIHTLGTQDKAKSNVRNVKPTTVQVTKLPLELRPSYKIRHNVLCKAWTDRDLVCVYCVHRVCNICVSLCVMDCLLCKVVRTLKVR
jgi:hypothetical protein